MFFVAPTKLELGQDGGLGIQILLSPREKCQHPELTEDGRPHSRDASLGEPSSSQQCWTEDFNLGFQLPIGLQGPPSSARSMGQTLLLLAHSVLSMPTFCLVHSMVHFSVTEAPRVGLLMVSISL